MEAQTKIEKEKSAIQKLSPIILIVIMIAGISFLYFEFFGPNNEINNIIPIHQVGIIVDTEFINSEEFKSLKFIPDQSVFDDVEGDVPAGKNNPFVP